MKKILILILFISFTNTLSSQNDDPALLYKNSQYKKSLEIYLSMDYKKNPYILYNIANCYYKMNDKTNAMLYYLKAFKLLPRNKNIYENLIKASKSNGEILFSQDIPSIFNRIYYFFSDEELSVLFEFFFLIFTIFFIINLRKKSEKLTIYTIIFAFFCCISFIWQIMRKNSILYNPAITIIETKLYSGPKDSFSTLAIIPEGKLLSIISDSDENYLEVGIPSENIKGWISKKNVSIVKE